MYSCTSFLIHCLILQLRLSFQSGLIGLMVCYHVWTPSYCGMIAHIVHIANNLPGNQ